MRKVALMLMLFQGIATLLQPIGDSRALNLREIYQQCSLEDPDITPLDFIFEHLLNLESIVDCFEGKNETGEAEHQIPQAVEFSVQIAVIVLRTVQIDFQPQILFQEKIKYPICRGDFCSSNFYTDLLRPPIA